MKKILLIIWLYAVIPFAISGQRYVSGRITDAEDGDPIPAAGVFISNTTVGVASDAEGYFRLAIPGEGSYRLTVSHVGYQPVFMDIEPGNTSVEFHIALHAIELEELTVSQKIRYRQQDINLFRKTILGRNPSRKTIYVLNPEIVYYYYNSDTQTLNVTCREPLQIVNLETGYKILYILQNFTHNYNTDATNWSYQAEFTELEPANDRQKNIWEKNRKDVYRVSLTKFVKSLYHNSLIEDGFVLALLNRTHDAQNPYQLTSIDPETILESNTFDNSKILNLTNRQVLLICYGKPVTNYDISKLQGTANLNKNWSNFGLHRNFLYGGVIRFFPDGTYTNKISLATVNDYNPINGLNMMLPVDYNPEGSILSDITEVQTDDISESDKIIRHITNQLSVFPQEKIHIHTDRDFYVPGEKIWFKAYLTDAATHQPVTYSRYIYVELISEHDSLVNRVMIRPENEMYYGHLPIATIIPEGNYTLRAYTRHMENLGDDYFFKKNIRIGSIKGEIGESRGNGGNRGNGVVGATLAVAQPDFDVSFFPEGGNVVEGVFNKVAFKALNRDGTSAIISGELVDETGASITSVATFHAGMGAFDYIPVSGKRYFLLCRNGNGLEKKFELPHPGPPAYALTVTRRNNRLSVGIRKSTYSPDKPCYLLAHCRGMLFHFSALNNSNEFRSFPDESLPAGVIQFVLFDEQMNPLSERLAFNNNFADDIANIEFKTDKASYEKREKVVATLTLPPSPLERAGVRWHFSIAITDDTDVTVDESATILSTLLLSSELKGYIENPAYYLQDNPVSVMALDYLMLTHGWRRYNIPEVVKGNLSFPQIPFQGSQKIAGKVKSLTVFSSATDSEVSMMTRAGYLGITTTDRNNAFLFPDFEYPDSTSYFIQALNKRGGSQMELIVDPETFPILIHAPQSSHRPPTISNGEGDRVRAVDEGMKNESTPDAFLVKAEQRSHYDEDMRVIHLSEVEVSAKRIEKKEEPRLQYFANIGSDITIRREEFEKRNPTTVTDLLRFVSGVSVEPNGLIIIRGAANRIKEIPPLILINGIATQWPDELIDIYDSPLEKINVLDVESIDVFKGASAAMFGVRGYGGVISITTKQGVDVRKREEYNSTVYTPLGYQRPVEFYSPKYETLESKHLTIPDYRTTIFWKPDIVVSESDEASFDFYTSDFQTTYSVVIEGLTSDGRIVRQVEKIRVE